MPPGDLMERVSGFRDKSWFKRSAEMNVEDFAGALEAIGRPLDSFHDVLDFGCGCGRLLGPLVSRMDSATISGSDIDAEAIAWVNENFPAVDARVQDGLPPLPFERRSFDLVLGFSVFTHLDETYQDAWLAELRRVTRPGALLAVTVHGEAAWKYHREVPFPQMSHLSEADIAAMEETMRSAGFVHWRGEGWERFFPDYYHTTFHSPAYVREHWSRQFEVVDVIEGGGRPTHDLVILRRSASPRKALWSARARMRRAPGVISQATALPEPDLTSTEPLVAAREEATADPGSRALGALPGRANGGDATPASAAENPASGDVPAATLSVCTIVARNYLAHARVFANSLRQQHPDVECHVLVIDDVAESLDDSIEPFTIVRPAQLEIERFEGMAAMYDVTELSTAVKPWLLRWMLSRSGGASVAYFDPDIRFYGPIGNIAELVHRHRLLLTPHVDTALPRDGAKPSDLDMLASGAYNLGFVAVAPGVETERLLDWWMEHLRFDCLIDHQSGRFVDQRWFDLVPGMVDSLHLLRDPGFNVAYWNLHSRRVAIEAGGYTVNGAPLRFFHFSGFDPEAPHALSKHQTRTRLQDHTSLIRLCEDYVAELRAQGYEELKEVGYGYDRLADGTELTPELRRAYRDGEMEGVFSESPFTLDGAAEFTKWLSEVVPSTGLPRLLDRIWRGDPELQASFPDLAGGDDQRLIAWFDDQPRGAFHLPELLLPDRAVKQSVEPPAAGVNVVGYLRSELGIAEAARSAIAALDEAGVPVWPLHPVHAPSSRQGHEFGLLDAVTAPFPVNLICVNADNMPRLVRELGAEFFADRYSIGLWFWEVSAFPNSWLQAFTHLDEIWVATDHIARALAPISPVPVTKVTIPVAPPAPPPRSRAALGLPEGFLFLTMFDYHSIFDRKNPLAVVEAFKRAFEPGAGPTLVVKSINHEHDPGNHDRLRAAVRNRDDVLLIDDYLAPGDKDAMVASCDCFVSLHRSEGLGLGPAEAMFAGKPVIATGYSGNLDFMTTQNSYLVDFALQPIGPGRDPYPAAGEWAEPDVEQAAQLMREIAGDPETAAARGERAAHDIRETHSLAAAGRKMAERLKSLQPKLRDPRAGFGQTRRQLAELRELVDLGAEGSAAPRRGTGLIRRALLRLLRPYSAYAARVDRTSREAFETMADELAKANSELDARSAAAEALAGVRRQTWRTAGIESKASSLETKIERLEQLTAGLDRFEEVSTQARMGARLADEMRESPAMWNLELDLIEEDGRTVYGYQRDSGTDAGGYRSFEDIFRGPEELIREMQEPYVDLLAAHQPVLDAGCGRGEMLGLLRDRGIEASGVDFDASMVEAARAHGYEVAQADALDHLEQLEDGSLGAIFSAQFIEHLRHDKLERFLVLSRQKLRSGGLLISETVNPHSAQALKMFWTDPSHEHPIFPEVALGLCRISGFESAFAFHPGGSGDYAKDRDIQGSYAVVARTGPGVEG